MATETVRPTTYADKAGTVTDPADAYDQSDTTYCELEQTTIENKAEVHYKVWGQAAQVSDAGRTTVNLKIRIEELVGVSANDTVKLGYCKDDGNNNWQTITEQNCGSYFDDTEKTIEITTDVDEDSEFEFVLGVMFWHTAGSASPAFEDV